MGQTFSSSSNSNKTPASTPQRTPNGECLDPRSPSQDIERTPIQFNENSGPGSTSNGSAEKTGKKEDKSKKLSLRQKMFERKKNGEVLTEK